MTAHRDRRDSYKTSLDGHGGRNLTPDQEKFYRGRQYNRKKAQGSRNDLTFRQNVGKLQTAEILAEKHGVSPRTIEREVTPNLTS